MAKKTTNRGGRPKGKKDSIPRKKKKSIKKKPAARPEVTPYPQAGDNPEFEGLLDIGGVKTDSKPSESSGEPGDPLLQGNDVAEWIAWPFLFLAQRKKIPELKLNNDESRSVAEPLTRILNRHGVAEVVPPDYLDGLTVLARLTPILASRHEIIKQAERAKVDAKGRASDNDRQTTGHGSPVAASTAQGISVDELKNPIL